MLIMYLTHTMLHDFTLMILFCDKKNNASNTISPTHTPKKDVYILIPKTCGYITYMAKGF